jgi:hypothetical protein
MKKNSLVRSIIFAGVSGALFCSNPFKPSTELGQNIITNLDSSITNIEQNIRTFKTAARVVGVSSRRDIDDTIPEALQRRPYFLSAGIFTGLTSIDAMYNAEAISYIEFRPSVYRDILWAIVRDPLKQASKIDSIVFFVNRLKVTVDSVSPPATGRNTSTAVDIFACGLQRDSTLLYTNSITTKIATKTVSLDSSAADSVYSVHIDQLDSSYARRLLNTVRSDTSADTAWFAFCLKGSPNASGVARFYGPAYGSYAPRITIYYHKGADTALQSAPLPCSGVNSYVSTFEPVFSAGADNATPDPVSSSGTNRRAVIKLDVSAVKAYMDDSAASGRKFMIIQRADLSIKPARITTDLKRDSLQVLYNVSDTLAVGQNSFKKVSSFYIRTGASPDTNYVLPLASWIQPLIVNRKSTVVYLYLTLPAQGQPPAFAQIDWAPPDSLKLNTIVTNPR